MENQPNSYNVCELINLLTATNIASGPRTKCVISLHEIHATRFLNGRSEYCHFVLYFHSRKSFNAKLIQIISAIGSGIVLQSRSRIILFVLFVVVVVVVHVVPSRWFNIELTDTLLLQFTGQFQTMKYPSLKLAFFVIVIFSAIFATTIAEYLTCFCVRFFESSLVFENRMH